MQRSIPDPLQSAQKEVEYLEANRDAVLRAPLERVLADAPFLDPARLLAGLGEFHRERMARIPSPAKYPESSPWADYVRSVDRHVQKLAGLTDDEMALLRSLGHYLTFRGYGRATDSTDEKCRVAYVPFSDHGMVRIKNVDDPATWYRPDPNPPLGLCPRPGDTLWSDGVGSGLHLDDEPEEIFPLPVLHMLPFHADDVPSGVGFLRRYAPFWGGGNLLLHDRQKRSVAIEKCSYNFFEIFEPGPDGISHISGMTCRDPGSPQGRYQRQQRQKYLDQFRRPADCADNAYWDMSRRFEERLAGELSRMDHPVRLDDLIRLFTTPWPQGLNKTGQRIHPEQGLIGYTLVTVALLWDERRVLRWQRSAPPALVYPERPEAFEF